LIRLEEQGQETDEVSGLPHRHTPGIENKSPTLHASGLIGSGAPGYLPATAGTFFRVLLYWEAVTGSA